MSETVRGISVRDSALLGSLEFHLIQLKGPDRLHVPKVMSKKSLLYSGYVFLKIPEIMSPFPPTSSELLKKKGAFFFF